MDVKYGDIVTVAPPGEFGKPRPALVLQKRIYPETELITVALITGTDWPMPEVRIPIARSTKNGLELDSFVMIDMVQTYRRTKAKQWVGHAEPEILLRVREALVVFFGFDAEL